MDNGAACDPAMNAVCVAGRCLDAGQVYWPTTDTSPPQNRFTVVGETVQDSGTQLQWHRSTATGTMAQGDQACRASTLEGLDDWRMPTITELTSLLDLRAANGHPGVFLVPAAGPFLTSSPVVMPAASGSSSGAPGSLLWAVSATGAASIQAFAEAEGAWRCVRSMATTTPNQANRFTVFDNSIRDNGTGLVWTHAPAIAGPGALAEVRSACASRTTMSFSDWRLPRAKELLSLVMYGRAGPALPTELGITMPHTFWSGSTGSTAGSAVAVNTWTGGWAAQAEDMTNTHGLCVRNTGADPLAMDAPERLEARFEDGGDWIAGAGTLVDGRWGTGVKLVGTESVSYSTTAPIGTGDAAVMAWVRFDVLRAGVFIGSPGFTTEGWSLGLDAQARIHLVVNIGDGPVDVMSPAPVTAGTWYHLAFTRAAAEVHLYVDGMSVGLGTPTGDNNLDDSATLTIGRHAMNASSPDVTVDDVLVWDNTKDLGRVREVGGFP